MAQQLLNKFSSFALSDKEQEAGEVLSLETELVLQNEVALLAEELVALKYDPQNAVLFYQQQAYKSGQLDQLEFILNRSRSRKNQGVTS
jgi:hypothetical protein